MKEGARREGGGDTSQHTVQDPNVAKECYMGGRVLLYTAGTPLLPSFPDNKTGLEWQEYVHIDERRVGQGTFLIPFLRK